MCDTKKMSREVSKVLHKSVSESALLKANYNIAMQHELNSVEITYWNPLNIFDCPDDYKYGIIVLNRPISPRLKIPIEIWKKAKCTITVDGGTDRWIEYLHHRAIDIFSANRRDYLPTYVTGDMDSINPETLKKLGSLGVKIIWTPDQNHTDYTKALLQLGSHCRNEGIKLNGVFVIAETSGRLDHIIANLNTLYKSDEILEGVQVIQISTDSLSWLLKPGVHKIKIPEILISTTSWCGLLPCGVKVNCISTTGLKWDLNKSTMEFGGLVSSSNTYNGLSEVTIETDTPLIWSMGIEPLVDIETTNSQEAKGPDT